jgi:predicted DNA-binding transcriptional regulator AlpA
MRSSRCARMQVIADLPADLLPRRVLRREPAAAYIGLSADTLDIARRDGWGPKVIKLGDRAIGFRVCDLDAWLESRVDEHTKT